RMASVSGLFVVAAGCLLSVFIGSGPVAEAAAVAQPCCGRGAAFVAGAATGAAVSRIRHHGGGGFGGGCGCAGCCGRKKRGIPDELSNELIEELHDKIASDDSDQCGLMLVCELSQKEDHHLTGHEKLVMLPYKGAGASDGTKFGLYDEAVWHGKEGRECHKLYPLCGFSAPEIMWHTTQINITQPLITA
ncbi:unnamed protein product, partial [Meganyctiphanes norvegica]